jgi:hypothetical protein
VETAISVKAMRGTIDTVQAPYWAGPTAGDRSEMAAGLEATRFDWDETSNGADVVEATYRGCYVFSEGVLSTTTFALPPEILEPRRR